MTKRQIKEARRAAKQRTIAELRNTLTALMLIPPTKSPLVGEATHMLNGVALSIAQTLGLSVEEYREFIAAHQARLQEELNNEEPQESAKQEASEPVPSALEFDL